MNIKNAKLAIIYKSLSEKEKILFEIYAIATLIKLDKADGFNITKTRINNLEGDQKTIYTIEMEER